MNWGGWGLVSLHSPDAPPGSPGMQRASLPQKRKAPRISPKNELPAPVRAQHTLWPVSCALCRAPGLPVSAGLARNTGSRGWALFEMCAQRVLRNMPGAGMEDTRLGWYSYLENKCEYLKPFMKAFFFLFSFLVEKHLFPLCICVALTVFLTGMKL